MTGFEIALIAGTAMQAYSSYQAGVDAKAQARQQAAFAEYNAKVAKNQAEAERQSTQREAEQHRRKSQIILSKMRANIGKSGVAMSGSPLLVLEDTSEQLNIERADILARGSSRATAYEQQSILDTAKSKAYKSRGDTAYKAGIIGAGSDLFGGYADYKYKKSLLN